jgi:hypothetical protein
LQTFGFHLFDHSFLLHLICHPSHPEARNSEKVLKPGQREQVASSQIILQGIGDLPLLRTTPKCPFWNSTFVWTQTGAWAQGRLIMVLRIFMSTASYYNGGVHMCSQSICQSPKATPQYHTHLLPFLTP